MARSSLPRFFLRANTALRQLTVTFHSGPQGVGRPLSVFPRVKSPVLDQALAKCLPRPGVLLGKVLPWLFLGVRHDDEHDRGAPGAQFSFNAT